MAASERRYKCEHCSGHRSFQSQSIVQLQGRIYGGLRMGPFQRTLFLSWFFAVLLIFLSEYQDLAYRHHALQLLGDFVQNTPLPMPCVGL